MMQRDKKKGFDLKRHRAEWDSGFAAAVSKTVGEAAPARRAAGRPQAPEPEERTRREPALARSGAQTGQRGQWREQGAAAPSEVPAVSSARWGALETYGAAQDEPAAAEEDPTEPTLSIPRRRDEPWREKSRAELSATGLAEVTAPDARLAAPAAEAGGAGGGRDGSGGIADVYLALPPGAVEKAISLPRAHPILSSLAVLAVAAGAALSFTLQGGSGSLGDSGANAVAVEQIPEPPRSSETVSETEAAAVDSTQPAARAALGAQAGDTMPLPSVRPDGLEGPAAARETAEAAPANPEAVPQDSGAPTPEQVAALVERLSGAEDSRPGEGIAPENAGNLVAEVQRALLWRGFDPGPVDGRLGDRTRAAVRAFQRKIGVEADGNIDLEVLRQLKAIETAPGSPAAAALPPAAAAPRETQLASATPFDAPSDEEATSREAGAGASAAARGEEDAGTAPQATRATVLAVQRALRRHGYEPGPLDGIEGAQTRAAIRSYQRRSGVAVDGRVDPALLDSLLNTPVAASQEEESGSLEDRVAGAVDSVADLFGLEVEDSADSGFAAPSGSRNAR